MKLLIELDEEYVKVIDKLKFLVGGRTDRKLQLEIIKAIKNGKALEQEPTTKIEESNFSQEQYLADIQSAYDCGKSVIDKIRAEIQKLRNCSCSCSDGIIDDVEDILDKYKGESEG